MLIFGKNGRVLSLVWCYVSFTGARFELGSLAKGPSRPFWCGPFYSLKMKWTRPLLFASDIFFSSLLLHRVVLLYWKNRWPWSTKLEAARGFPMNRGPLCTGGKIAAVQFSHLKCLKVGIQNAREFAERKIPQGAVKSHHLRLEKFRSCKLLEAQSVLFGFLCSDTIPQQSAADHRQRDAIGLR